MKAEGQRIVDPDAALSQVGAAGQAGTVVATFNPAVVLISGCQDNQTSMDGDHNGAFTEQLLKVWNHGAFEGSYGNFHTRIRAAMPPTQSPNLFVLGQAASLLAQTPFTV
jgi:metacaspase-1